MTAEPALEPADQVEAATAAPAPLVSVVIPARNAALYLSDCLASVRIQAGGFELETIVIDDGSTDETTDVAQRHAGVTLVSQPNKGPGAARNAGLELAQGQFIAFLDADDLWPPNKLVAQLRDLERYPDAGLVFGDCQQFDSEGPLPQTLFESGSLGSAAWERVGILADAFRQLLRQNFITTGSVVARREVLADVGGFSDDLVLVEDLDLWLRIARLYPIAWSSEICLLRRKHDKNTSRDTVGMSLAYLEVLQRQRRLGLSSDDSALARRLIVNEYLKLALVAYEHQKRREALAYIFRGIAAQFTVNFTRPTLRNLGNNLIC